jgi:hypothetical protein
MRAEEPVGGGVWANDCSVRHSVISVPPIENKVSEPLRVWALVLVQVVVVLGSLRFLSPGFWVFGILVY